MFIRKRKQEAILCTRRYKIHAEPEKYYHAKLLLYYPWNHENDIISTYATYHYSYMSKQNLIHQNAKQFNEDCHDNTRNTTDTLCMLYAKAAKRQDMNFHNYCRHVNNLNTDQCHIVMYNRAWCKSYINAIRHEEKQKGYRIFLSGPGGQGKVMLYISYKETCITFSNTVKPDNDQPIVLITAPTGSAAFQIGGSIIHSTLLLHNYKSKPSWVKRSKMQLKLEHMMLSITDEISMVGFKQFQSMNQTMCALKGTTGGNWGDICVLAVGDLYQLPSVGQCPVYMSP